MVNIKIHMTENQINLQTNRKMEDMFVFVNNATQFVVAVYQPKNFGFEENSLAQELLFKDFENNDFTLSKNSSACKIGFKSIDIKNIGVIR